ncbi:MAG: hypothetical protein HQL24_09875 [Candidatus Omnitrophica bacterium]|nr:hypothetical protein [Candidatus Omnitrophota bacterium]
MKIVKGFFLVACVIFMTGCAWLPWGKHGSANAPQKTEDADAPLKVQRIVEADLLKDGENILIAPFTAGEDVRATEEMDKDALMLVRGVYDELQEKKSWFKIITAETVEKSDFLIEGHITKISEPSWFARFILRKKKKTFGVEGKMTDLNTGRIIFSFEDEVSSGKKGTTYLDLSHLIGVRLARFILSAVQTIQ